MKHEQENKGITLISLVITIIVMLILVAVVVNVSLGDNGLFNKAKEAAQRTNVAATSEISMGNEVGSYIDSLVGGAVLGENSTEEYHPEEEKIFTFTINEDGVTVTGLKDGGILHNNFEIPSTIEGMPVTSIGEGAFQGCSGLMGRLTIPSSVTSIGAYAFANCTRLNEVTIPSRVTTIGDNAFSGCGFKGELTIPSSVISIGKNAFRSCGLTGLTIQNGVTSIGEGAFKWCRGITEIRIPSSVEKIETNVFAYITSLENIYVDFTEGNTPAGWEEGWAPENVNIVYAE